MSKTKLRSYLISEDTIDVLKMLSFITDKSKSELVREALGMLILKYGEQLKKHQESGQVLEEEEPAIPFPVEEDQELAE